MIKEKKPMLSSDNAGLAILELLGITKPVTRVEIVINGLDPILINVSYFEKQYIDGIVCGIDTITKTHVLVEKETPIELNITPK